MAVIILEGVDKAHDEAIDAAWDFAELMIEQRHNASVRDTAKSKEAPTAPSTENSFTFCANLRS
ncbi:MAG: hypothetical protein WCD70_15970 [Alphaproteobacteria bacterium]